MLDKKMKNTILEIISINQKISNFWSNSHGWAPVEAATMLEKSRLDLQVSLSETLVLWVDCKNHPGYLRLAWTNLGALVEGSLKWFLAVYYKDYLKDPKTPKDKKIKPYPQII